MHLSIFTDASSMEQGGVTMEMIWLSSAVSTDLALAELLDGGNL